MEITVILLTYNEKDNLVILIPQIRKALDKIGVTYEILVIDAPNSADEMEAFCKENQLRYVLQEEPYYGGAFKTGIKYARGNKILNLDADCSHNPKYIPELYKAFIENDCDVTIGSRYIDGGVNHDQASSVLMSKLLNFVMRIATGLKVKELSTSYRLYDAAQLKDVTLNSKYVEILQEVLVKMKKKNRDLKIVEIPIVFEKRNFGETKRRYIPFITRLIGSTFYYMAIRLFNID